MRLYPLTITLDCTYFFPLLSGCDAGCCSSSSTVFRMVDVGEKVGMEFRSRGDGVERCEDPEIQELMIICVIKEERKKKERKKKKE